MRDFGSSILESGREGSRLVVVVRFLVKEGLSEESGHRRRSREEEYSAPRSRREGIFEHRRRNMLIYSGKWGGMRLGGFIPKRIPRSVNKNNIIAERMN